MKLSILTFLFALTTITSFGTNSIKTDMINNISPVISINQDNVPISLLPATVEISVKKKKEDEFHHSGTGWLFNPTAVITAKHVINGYEDSVKQKDGK
jgi:hypothetical protein